MRPELHHFQELVARVGGVWKGDHAHGDTAFHYDPTPAPGTEFFENHLRSYRPVGGRAAGSAHLLLLPKATQEVKEVLAYCSAHHIPVFTQGGNTGLVGASVPDGSARGVVLSTRRMDRILTPLRPGSATVLVEAGVIIDQLNAAAQPLGLFCSIKHGGTGSATAGGSAATNAGGANAVRYGVTRDQVVGIRVVTPLGEELQLGGTLKDTATLIDLKHLFIGSAGSLGVITEVELKLHPIPASREVAMVGLSDYAGVEHVLQRMRAAFPSALEAFEFMDADIFQASAAITENGASVLSELEQARFIALLEVSSALPDDAGIQDRLFDALADQDHVVMALDRSQRDLFWRIREHCNPASKQLCNDRGVFFDNCVPVDQVGASIQAIEHLLRTRLPAEMADGRLRVFHFGHCADGNVHTHVVQDAKVVANDFDIRDHAPWIDDRIIELVVGRFGGNPAAEHTIGEKTDRLRHTSPLLLGTVDAIKNVIDPAGIMNPGRGTLAKVRGTEDHHPAAANLQPGVQPGTDEAKDQLASSASVS